jgi:DNA-binding GntR family transcriptional regulator
MADFATPTKLTVLKTETAPLRHMIIDALSRAIELGVLKPGDRLVEKELCTQLGVSRTSLREALRELEAQRIIARSAVRGLIVSPLTEEDAANVYRVRGALEALLAEQFIERAQPSEVTELCEAVENLKDTYQRQDIEAIVEARWAYYEKLCAGARNPLIFDMLKALRLRTSVLRAGMRGVPGRQRESIDEIDRLVRCIVKGDIAGAREVTRSHLENAAFFALTVPAEEFGPETPRATG